MIERYHFITFFRIFIIFFIHYKIKRYSWESIVIGNFDSSIIFSRDIFYFAFIIILYRTENNIHLYLKEDWRWIKLIQKLLNAYNAAYLYMRNRILKKLGRKIFKKMNFKKSPWKKQLKFMEDKSKKSAFEPFLETIFTRDH